MADRVQARDQRFSKEYVTFYGFYRLLKISVSDALKAWAEANEQCDNKSFTKTKPLVYSSSVLPCAVHTALHRISLWNEELRALTM